ncbi:MAG: hypothetical protein FJW20_23790 [Acidimicrobiia bacterium]|nr:hypothetical protein [Acidimicrobiia bacterium]
MQNHSISAPLAARWPAPATLAVLLGLSAATAPAFGSGTYARTNPPSAAVLENLDRYETGKAIFTGATRPAPGTVRSASLDQRLKILEARLPQAARKSSRLADWSGGLTDDQWGALEYFLLVRYKVK